MLKNKEFYNSRYNKIIIIQKNTLYKKEKLKLKKEKNLGLDTEIKSYDMTEEEKIKIFNKIQDIETFNGCVKVFDKRYMIKETEFCIYDDDFKITYYDSKTNYGI